MTTKTTKKAAAKANGKAPAKAAPRPPGPTPAVRRAAEQLKQAGEPTRLQVLLFLAEGQRNVGTLTRDLGLTSQPACSHHLTLLRLAHLIEPQRRGKENHYRLTAEGQRLIDVVRSLVEG